MRCYENPNFVLRSLLRLALGMAGFALATSAAAATINVVAGQNLNQIMENANDGDVISVGPGTYTAQSSTFLAMAAGTEVFGIRRRLTVVSTGGPGVTTLRGGGPNAAYVVKFFAHNYNGGLKRPDGASLEGFTLQNAWGAVEANNALTGGDVIDNITIKNVVFTSSNFTASNSSHGISFQNVTNSKIDTATLNNPWNNGIYIFKGSGNAVTSSTVGTTGAQHAIALSNTTGALVAGNTVLDSAFHAIIALGTKDSRIERNSLTGFRHDGITVTNDTAPPGGFNGLSSSNFIGHNTIISQTWAENVFADGTGIFLNGDANGNYLFGNNMRGAPENGIAVFAGSSNYIQANRIHGNYQGGVLIWNLTSISGGVGGRPTNNLVRNNFIYYNPSNASVNLRDTLNTDVAFNFMSNANFAGDPANPTDIPGPTAGAVAYNPGGVGAANFPDPNPTANTSIYGNTFTGLNNSIYFDAPSSNTSIFRNKFLTVMDQYAISPATVVFDLGATMGGNFWATHIVTGNPSSGPAYTKIYCPGPVGCPYKDNFPFAADTLGQAASVSVYLPRSGAAVAAGSSKTISWDSKACTLVDIDLMSGASPVLAIATNYPDVGHFIWGVPSGQGAGTYSVRVTCKNASGASLSVTGTGPTFSVFTGGVKLLSPGPFAMPAAAGTMLVSWTRSAGVTGGVSIFSSVDGAAETTLATGVTGNSAVVTVPNVNSNRVVLRIVTGANQDSTDGYYRISQGTGQGFTSPTGGNFTYGSKAKLEWKSITGSRYVDIELNSGSGFQFVAQNVPDFGNYEYLIRDTSLGNNRQFRLTFKNATTQASPGLGQTSSSTFNVVAGTDMSITQIATPNPGNVGKDLVFELTAANNGPAPATGVVITDTLPPASTFIWASPGCTTGPGTVTCNVGSLASGTSVTYKVVVRPTGTGTATNNVSVSAAQADPSTGNNASALGVTINTTPAAVHVLRYRLYSDLTKEHHFTTDLNEYTVLGGNGVWVQEGTVGKVLNNPGSFNGVTAVPYYRLYDTSTRWHHWTTDANEYYTLAQFPWWNAEGVDGYILPTNTAGATQLYRLNYPALGSLHHWTIDSNEYTTLIASFGWVGEGGAGFVIQ